MANLYTAAIECGYVPRREEFRQRVMMADGNLAAARQETVDAYAALSESERAYRRAISELQSAYADLEKVAKNANDAYQGVIDSTTWRMTGPLRNAVHRIKGWRQRLSIVRWHVSRLPQDVKRASQLAKEQGVSAVIQKIAERSRAPSDLFDAPLPQFDVETELLPLSLGTSQTPMWSILIPVHGQHDFTYTCLKSIAETCAGLPIEVIVVDDCSETPASEVLSMVSGVEFRRNESNLGFLKTCNAASANVRGEFIVLLNNDTLVTGEWLQALTAVFEEDEKAGLVGAKLLFGNGRLQEAGGIVWRDGSASNYGRNEDPRRPEFNYRREADYCSAACVMIRRSLWNALGGFDERYVPAYYEDTDLAFRVREAGYKVIYQPHAEVVHFEGKSSGTDLTQGVKRHQVINQATFEARWRHVLSAHRPRGQMIHLERDRAALRRVLVIDVCLVRPDRDSGSLRMYEMLKAMRQLGCRVSFVADNREYVEKYARLTQSLGVEVLHAPYLSTPGEAITRHGAEFDVVMLSRAPVAVSHVDAVKKLMPHAKLVFDTVDLHFLRQEREAEVANDDALRTEAARMKKIELDLIAKADATLVVSSAEKDLLETIAPRAKVHVVSNIHEPAPGAKPFSARSGLVFIGGFRFAPNVDAMAWFASEILPLLRAKGTGIRTTVIGSDVPDELRRFAADDFEIAGIPERTNKEFSRRTTQIEKAAEVLGIKRPETKAKLGATTREPKREGLSWPLLLRAWQARLQPGELEAINATVREALQGPLALEDRSHEAVDWALRHLLERSSVVSERQVVTESLKHGLGSVTPKDVYAELGRRKDVIRRDVGGGRDLLRAATEGVVPALSIVISAPLRHSGTVPSFRRKPESLP